MTERLKTTGVEIAHPKEPITPTNIQKKVMEFFDGINLNKDQTAQKGIIDIITRPHPNKEKYPFKRQCIASIHGIEIASYEFHTNTDYLKPFEPSKEYHLNGANDDGEITLICSVYPKKDSKIRAEFPVINNFINDPQIGPIYIFDHPTKKIIAKTFGIEPEIQIRKIAF